MDSNPICHPSPAQKKWNAHFWITFNFWWSAGLINGLEPHRLPVSNQKIEMLVFGLHSNLDQPGWLMDLNPICHPSPAKKNEMFTFGLRSTSDDRLGWSMDLNPIHHPSPTKKMKCSFLDYIQLLMIGRAGGWTRTPSATPLQPEKWNACFCFIFTSDDWLGWSMDLNPIHHPSPAKKMKCLFLDYIQLLMISWAHQWTRTPSATRLQPKNWNGRFWITFKFWSAGLVDGLEPHLPPLSSQKKWNVHFWITFNFWWSAGLVDGLEPHPPPLSNQKNEMLIFGLHSTSDDWPCWWMDSNPICHPSPAKKMKCSFLDYVQLLMIGWAGWWTQTPSATPLQPKNEMLIFGLLSTSDDQLGWSINSNPICHLSPAKKTRS